MKKPYFNDGYGHLFEVSVFYRLKCSNGLALCLIVIRKGLQDLQLVKMGLIDHPFRVNY